MHTHQQIPTLSLKNTEKLPIPFLIERMQAIEDRRDKKTKTQPHKHDFYTVIWIKQASGSHFIDFKEYPVADHHLFFINPGQVHSLELETMKDGIVILFTEDFLCQVTANSDLLGSIELFQNFDNKPVFIPEIFRNHLQIITEILENEFNQSHIFQKDLLYAYLRAFLIQCIRIKNQQTKEDKPIMTKPQEILRHFKELVEKEYKTSHKVKDYADKLNITANHLNDIVKLQLGKTAKEIIQNRITLEARRNAYYTDCNLKEITYFLGFDDPAHFSKFFKKQTGITFLEFREQIRKEYLNH